MKDFKKFLYMSVVVLSFAMSACATIEGAGEDIESAGEEIQEAADS